jgi:membrane protease subunit (stomatin/prohibitin family)
MGLFDAIKNEAGRNFVARPPDHGNDIIYMWPDRNIRVGTQLTVHADEVVLFVKDGQVAGVLPPKGSMYTLDTHNVPFVSRLLESVTGGNLFMAELWFVLTREITSQRFGGPVGLIRGSGTPGDPTGKLAVTPLVHGEFSFKVTDPQQLVVGMVGLQQTNNDQVTDWFKNQVVLKIIREVISEMIVKQHMPLTDLTSAAYNDDIEKAVMGRVQAHMAPYGVQVAHMGNFELKLSDKDEAMLQKLTETMAYADVGMNPGLQGYAQAKMMMGAGEGMSKGGEGGGAALQGMGLGMGMSMANMFNQNQQQARQQPPPPSGAPAAAGLTCPKCGQSTPPGKFCGNCGAPLVAAGPKHCTQCGSELAPGTKFCGSCGTPAA